MLCLWNCRLSISYINTFSSAFSRSSSLSVVSSWLSNVLLCLYVWIPSQAASHNTNKQIIWGLRRGLLSLGWQCKRSFQAVMLQQRNSSGGWTLHQSISHPEAAGIVCQTPHPASDSHRWVRAAGSAVISCAVCNTVSELGGQQTDKWFLSSVVMALLKDVFLSHLGFVLCTSIVENTVSLTKVIVAVWTDRRYNKVWQGNKHEPWNYQTSCLTSLLSAQFI